MAKVRMENIVQSWEVNIPNQGGEADKFFDNVIQELKNKQAGFKPAWEHVGSLLGGKIKYLVVPRGKYSCYIGSKQYGTDLYCSWNLYDPRFTTSRDGSLGGLFKSDFNDILEMKTFSAVVLDCVINAAEKIFESGDVDKKRLKRESSGALGPI